MHKKVINTIAIGIMVSMVPIYSHAQVKLTDVNEHWAAKEIQNFVDKGYVNGYEDHTFKPNNYITRAEFIKLVSKYFGYLYYENLDYLSMKNYKDVNKNDWFYNYICTLVGFDYINGYDGYMRPNDYITREEATKIIVSTEHVYVESLDNLNNFNDKNNVSPWAKDYVEQAVKLGILKGDNNNLYPKSYMTRAEAVSMLSRVDNKDELEYSKIEDGFLKLIKQKGFEPDLDYYYVYEYYICKKSPGCGYVSVGDNGGIRLEFQKDIQNEEMSEFNKDMKESLDYLLPNNSDKVWDLSKNSDKDITLNLDGKIVEITNYGNRDVSIGIKFKNYFRFE